MRTLLPVAAAYYYAGQEELGFKILDPISEDLYRYPMSLAERTALAFTYAATLGHVPVRIARGRFGDLFQFLKKITINGWNTHYTLQPLKLIDTAILAIVSEDLLHGLGRVGHDDRRKAHQPHGVGLAEARGAPIHEAEGILHPHHRGGQPGDT